MILKYQIIVVGYRYCKMYIIRIHIADCACHIIVIF